MCASLEPHQLGLVRLSMDRSKGLDIVCVAWGRGEGLGGQMQGCVVKLDSNVVSRSSRAFMLAVFRYIVSKKRGQDFYNSIVWDQQSIYVD